MPSDGGTKPRELMPAVTKVVTDTDRVHVADGEGGGAAVCLADL